MLGTLLGPEIKEMIARRDFAGLRETFADFPPAEAGELIAELPEDERVVLFRILPHALAADVFEYLDSDAQEALLKAMGTAQAASILNEMSPDDRTALLEELPGAAVVQLIQLLSPEEKAIAQALLNYPEGVAVAPSGIVYVSDTASHALRVFNGSWLGTLVKGGAAGGLTGKNSHKSIT